MIRGLILVLALVTPALAQDAKVKPSFVGGAGALPCDKWLSERENGTSMLAVALESWLMGFVSSSYNSEGRGVDVNEEDVLTRTDFYCREHRTDILFQAALVVTADLLNAEVFRALKDTR
jgi:hypothetical protein